MISARQRVQFFKAMDQAWAVHCLQAEIPAGNKEAKDAWRRAEMEREAGVRSVKDMNHTTDYDTMMLHWAIIAGNDAGIDYFGEAAERRLRKLILGRMNELAQLTEKHVTWAYVRAIHGHMHLPLEIEHCDTRALTKLLQAMDTHCRRLRRAVKDAPPVDDDLPF